MERKEGKVVNLLCKDFYMNLESTVNTMGETVTEIIHFSNGNKRTFHGIVTSTIKQWEFTKMNLTDGRLLMVNTANVDCIEVFKEVPKD